VHNCSHAQLLPYEVSPSKKKIWAEYTVRVSKLELRNCVQSHDNTLEVLRHIILYLLTKLPQSTGHPGHAGAGFLEIPYFQKFCPSRPRIFSKDRQKIIKFFFAGLRPAPNPYGAVPRPPTKVGAKCLAAVVLAHHGRVLSPCLSP